MLERKETPQIVEVWLRRERERAREGHSERGKEQERDRAREGQSERGTERERERE